METEIARFLGVGDVPETFAFETIGTTPRDGYDELQLAYDGDDGERIPALLLRPPVLRGAVLVQHQHASQWHLGKSEVAGHAGNPLQAFGPALARAGLAVLAPDAICFEDRRVHTCGIEPGEGKSDWLQHYNAMAHRLVRGELLMRRVLRDAMRALSVLRAIAGDRVGTLGHSYGGNTVLFHAAIDRRVAFACASGAASTYRRKIADGTGIEMSEIIPGFAARWDIDDLVRAISPRPLLLVSGRADPYSRDADEIEAAARPTWDAAGAGSALEHRRDDGAHDMTAERFEHIVAWTVRHAA